ncbi:MAG: glycosyltransferase [Verrucomicrobiales bacterium]
MRVRFVSPPAALQVGGIENALKGMQAALEGVGVEVVEGVDVEDRDAVHHFHGLWSLPHVGEARRLRKAGLPYVVSPHGMLEPWAFRHRAWKKRPFFSLLGRPMIEAAEAVVVTSEMEGEHVAKLVTAKHVEVLPLGCRDTQKVDYQAARSLLGWNEDEPVLVFLSRIDEKKGLDFLLKGLAAAASSDVKLVVVGSGHEPYVDGLKQLAKELKLRVEWVGPVWGADRWPYLQGADAFCLTTHSENFGIAVLEAMHVGTPVLTTEGTPWRDHRDREGVWICQPEVNSIRDSLTRLLAKREDWGNQARESLASWAEQEFSWPSLAPRYLEMYEKVRRKELRS